MRKHLSQKTIALIGGTGFVGRAVVQALAPSGAKMLILARNAARAKTLKPLGDVGQITAIAGNVLDDDTLRTALAPADIVINLVGILAPSGRQNFQAIQADLPARIAHLASQTRISQIIHISALGASLKSPSLYARTKAMGERNLLRQFNTAVILRPSVIFGPGDNFFNRFGQMAMLSPILPLIGGGHNKMQPVYVGDVAKAVCAVLTRPDVAGKVFQLGGPQIYSFADLMRFTLQATGRDRLLLSVPFGVMVLPAALMGLMPSPPLTLDQLRLLRSDNIVQKSLPSCADLGIKPTAIESIVPSYLASYRPGGRFAPPPNYGT